MNNPAAAFITILEIELRDLEEDIQMLMADYEVRRLHEEISNYVYMENLALLKKELFGVDGILNRLTSLDPAAFGSPEEVGNFLLDDIKDRINRKHLPPVILSLVVRKFSKVMGYLNT